MANLFAFPSQVIGMMGRQMPPPRVMADAEDERMFAANPNGDQLNQLLGAMLLGQQQPAQAAPVAPQPTAPAVPERRRVSPWRVLDRVLGGETITGGLDAERERERAEAMRPLQQQRIEAALSAITDPRERALFMGLGGEDWQKNVGQQFAPQVIGAGGIQSVVGTGTRVGAPAVGEFGDRVRVTDPLTGQTTYSDPRPATFSEQTARINATNPVNVAQDARLVDQYTGQTIAQGLSRPDAVTTGQGAITSLIGPDGTVQNTIQGNPTTTPGRNGVSFDATTRGALQSATDSANAGRTRAANAKRFIELNRDRGTGVGAAMLGPATALDPKYAEMRAIAEKLVPAEREPGSGPMSDRDIDLYRGAVINLRNPGPTNEALANVVIAQAERDSEYASFLDEYALRNGNIVGANEDWQAYVNANPLFEGGGANTRVRETVTPWRTFMGYGERQRGGAGRANGGSTGAQSGPIAINRATGQRIQWNGSAWVPVG